MTDKLRTEDLETDALSAEELAKKANAVRPREGAALEELMADLERSSSPAEASAWPPILEEPRLRVDTRHAEPATSHRPVVGPVLVAAKRTFRVVFQPFINEVLRRQVEFNEAILSSMAGIYEQVRVNARTQALWRDEVMRRLEKLEQARTAQPRPPAPKKPKPARR